MIKHIVLNYDLGLKGDYENLYAFLDNHNAIDIGYCNAAFAMDFSDDNFETIYEELKAEISKVVNINTNDRIYMVVTDHECRMQGKFLFGKRKRAIWEGYGYKEDTEIETDKF